MLLGLGTGVAGQEQAPLGWGVSKTGSRVLSPAALAGSGWKGEAPLPQRILDLLLNENLEVKREGKYEMAHRTQNSHSRASFVNDT